MRERTTEEQREWLQRQEAAMPEIGEAAVSEVDLVERLRNSMEHEAMCDEAADEIERMREALQTIAKGHGPPDDFELSGCVSRGIAIAVLDSKERSPDLPLDMKHPPSCPLGPTPGLGLVFCTCGD